jgi:MYXO-CTERM domain-containing protein
MKKKLVLLSVMLITLAASISAAPMTFIADLSGLAEEPPNASPATGSTVVTFDPVAHTLHVQVTFSGLLGPTTVSHIHVINGPGDANTSDTIGPVATTTPTFPGFPTAVTAGVYDQTFDTLSASSYRPDFVTDSGGVGAAELELFNAITSGRAYLNVHSTLYPAGEIRGFLEPIPEPATMGVGAIALAGLTLLRRRQQRRA